MANEDQQLPADTHGAVELGAGRTNQPAGGPSAAPDGYQAPYAPDAQAGGGSQLTGPLVRDGGDDNLGELVEISRQLPVILDLWAQWCQPCKQLGPILEEAVRAAGGRVVLVKIDIDANPQIASALHVQSVPTVIALVAGQPVPLFQGAQPREQVNAVIDQLIAVGQANGLTGVMVDTGEPAADQPDPLHLAALEAQEAEDWERAAKEWESVLAKAPRDQVAKEGLAMARLQARISAEGGSSAADEGTTGGGDIFARADQLVAAGDSKGAFDLLLDAFAAGGGEEEAEAIRARIVELFTLVGPSDPAVKEARRRLSSLLF